VWEWFVSVKTRQFPIDGPLIQNHAKEVAKNLRKSDFSAYHEWLDSF
jgi:hypothetical protein